MRAMGIDYGSKRVGIAVSDETKQMAFPHSVLQNSPDLLLSVIELARSQGVDEIVLGESRDFAGMANPIMRPIIRFKDALEEGTGITVAMAPELFTTMQAERLQGKHDKIDASAAALILQSYLDKRDT